MLIYLLTNIRNGKVYVGQTKSLDGRMRRHLNEVRRGTNRHLYDAIRKYGADVFRVEVIEKVSDLEADDAECMWIEFYSSNNREFGYNMTKGGGGGDTFTNHPKKEEIRKKHQAREWTGEQREKFSASMVGRKREPFSKEWREKIRQSLIESGCRPPINSMPGELHPMWGKAHSEEAKAKISAARMGKTYEQIFGEKKAAAMREAKRQKYVGPGNPFFKEMPMREILLALIAEPNLKMDSLAKQFRVSRPTVSKRLRDLFACENLQRLRECVSPEEFQQLCKEKVNAMEVA
ncbi:MAG: GIY-YIG nuclease family protein [Betaproteobacteria bacterium]|nr:GIY-YIG nuclease family protein [Betaproteobacteria bacterium]